MVVQTLVLLRASCRLRQRVWSTACTLCLPLALPPAQSHGGAFAFAGLGGWCDHSLSGGP